MIDLAALKDASICTLVCKHFPQLGINSMMFKALICVWVMAIPFSMSFGQNSKKSEAEATKPSSATMKADNHRLIAESYSKMLFSIDKNKEIADEIELSDDQIGRIKAIRDSLDGRTKNEFRKQRELIGPKATILDSVLIVSAQGHAEVLQEVLPHQVKRLEQFLVTEITKRYGLIVVLKSEWAKNALKIDKEQAKKIRERIASEKERLLKEIKKLEEEVEKNILSELSPTQRQTLNEMSSSSK